MPLPRGIIREGHRTVATRERTLSGVQPHVIDQPTFHLEGLVAHLALEWKRCAAVIILVRDELCFLVESSPTGRTDEGSFVQVVFLMCFQGTATCEVLLADITRKRFLIVMIHFVV